MIKYYKNIKKDLEEYNRIDIDKADYYFDIITLLFSLFHFLFLIIIFYGIAKPYLDIELFFNLNQTFKNEKGSTTNNTIKNRVEDTRDFH